ncbi:2OG-Fe(II) oxygenase family protein [Maricaulaceae bacterium MS644]
MVNTAFTDLLRRATALKSSGRMGEALELYRQAVTEHPESPIAQHNLAAALGDAGSFGEAAKVAEAVLSTGFDAAETWLVLARAQMNLDLYEPARKSFEAVIARRPDMVAAYYELCQLIWMYTGDAAQALAPIEAALTSSADAPGLLYVRAKVLESIGETGAACETMARLCAARPGDLQPHLTASYLSAEAGRPEEAIHYAERALRLAPGSSEALLALACAQLANGRPDEAASLAGQALARSLDDQFALAVLAAAWRGAGDPRAAELYDYESFVHAGVISPPAGWATLEAYLGDLSGELKAANPYTASPFGQSVRNGSQRPDILQAGTPAISAFAEAADPVIQTFMAKLGEGADPVRRRNTLRWRRHGVWSVWLRPGGFHTDHVHPSGWLSSAFYVEVPPCVNEAGRQGWIEFGRPGVPVSPRLAAEHAVRPEPGLLVLFPSYMWHGTAPFSGEAARLTMAMDIVPA